MRTHSQWPCSAIPNKQSSTFVFSHLQNVEPLTIRDGHRSSSCTTSGRLKHELHQAPSSIRLAPTTQLQVEEVSPINFLLQKFFALKILLVDLIFCSVPFLLCSISAIFYFALLLHWMGGFNFICLRYRLNSTHVKEPNGLMVTDTTF